MSGAEVAVSFGTPRPGVAPVRSAARDFPMVEAAARLDPDEMTIAVELRAWRAGEVDTYWLDARIDALGERGLHPVAACGEPTARLELLTRCQRWSDRRNRHSSVPWWRTLLDFHRSLHDRERPLERAGHNHALDTWQWTLRLDPEAGAAVQVAALFHDLERRELDADRRVELLLADYDSPAGSRVDDDARRMADFLAGTPVPPLVARRAAEIIAGGGPGGPHDSGDPGLALLADADALSFFLVGSAGFLDDYGAAQAARKIAWKMRRLSLRACPYLPLVRLRHDVASLLGSVPAAMIA
jgi:hypothetical protein